MDTPKDSNLLTMEKKTAWLVLAINCPYISTFIEGKTSEQLTKYSSQQCPLFVGSTL